MSKSVTKARGKRASTEQSRMIPRFCQRPGRAAGSFVTDLDTTGTIGEIMLGAPRSPCVIRDSCAGESCGCPNGYCTKGGSR